MKNAVLSGRTMSKTFFIDNYDHPIFECGRQLTDMVYLRMDLSAHKFICS